MAETHVVCLWTGEVAHLQGLAESALRYSPRIAMGKEAVFLDISGTQSLYSSSSLLARLKILAQRFAMGARVSLSGDPCSALALARWGVPDTARLPIAALRDYANPFGGENLAQVDEAIENFRRLGLHKLMDFFRLPRRSLAEKFGKEGLFWLYRMEEAARIPWPMFRPQERVIEEDSVDPLHEVRDLEPLSFVLKTLLDRLCARLRGLGQRVTRLRLRIEVEKHSLVREPMREWILVMVLPQGGAQGLLSVVRERLNRDLQDYPLESSVIKINLEVLETAPTWSSQRDFFSGEQDQQEEWASLIGRLTEKLGENRVFQARLCESYRPESTWNVEMGEPRVGGRRKMICENEGDRGCVSPNEDVKLKAPNGNHSWRTLSKRPLRLLSEPMPLSRNHNVLSAPQVEWEVSEWQGPEVLAGEWWQSRFEREYYCVRLQTGEQLWIFRDRLTQQFFLHGAFD